MLYFCDTIRDNNNIETEKGNVEMENTTLVMGYEKNPRYTLEKCGWDGTPRHLLTDSFLAVPAWTLGYDREAWDHKPIGTVTNFPNEGWTATIDWFEIDGDSFSRPEPKTFTAKDFDELMEVIEYERKKDRGLLRSGERKVEG